MSSNIIRFDRILQVPTLPEGSFFCVGVPTLDQTRAEYRVINVTDLSTQFGISTGFTLINDTPDVVFDFSTNGTQAQVTLNDNRSLTILNGTDGQVGTLVVKQDATGGRLLSLPPEAVSLGVITLSTLPNSVDVLEFVCRDGFFLINKINSGAAIGGVEQIDVVNQYSDLPPSSSVPDKFYWVTNSQGTSWLPGSLGGTYYSDGLYYSNGTSWESMDVPYQATLAEVNAGTVTNKFVTPSTFQGADRWATKVDTEVGKGLSTEDYTTAEKSKLAGIAAGAEVNVNADWSAVSGDAQILNKPSTFTPSAHTHTTSDITDLSSYTGLDVRYYTESEVTTLLASYLTISSASSTYQPLDGDLTSIAGLAGTSGLLRKTAANTFTLDTASYLTGNQTITLSGVVTGSGTTAITTSIANGAITNAMLANSAVANLSGTNTGDNAVNSLYSGLVSNATHTGDATGATALTVVGIRNVSVPTLATGNLRYNGSAWIFDSTTYLTGNQSITLSGDLSGSGATSISATIAADSVSNTKLANMAANTLKGNNTGSTADPIDLSVAQVKTLLAYTAADVGASATGHTHTLANISDVTITVANLNILDDGLNTTLHFHDADRSRANHTGTQLASTISDFSTAADARIAAASINALSDVVITAPSTGQVLKYNGTNWINDTDATGGGGVSDGDKGDITVSGTGATWTIDAAAVSYSKIQNVAANTFLANATGSAASVQEIATNRIPLFSSAITGTPDSSTYLRGDGSWQAPPGGGGGLTFGQVNRINTILNN